MVAGWQQSRTDRGVVLNRVASGSVRAKQHGSGWRTGRSGALAKQVELVLTDMLRAKLIGSTMKVFSKLLDREQIGSRGTWGIVATLEFFEHPVSELSHEK